MIEKVSKVYSINNFLPKKQKEIKNKQKRKTLLAEDSLLLSIQYKETYEEKRDIKYLLFLQNNLNEIISFLQNTVLPSLKNGNIDSDPFKQGIESVLCSMFRRSDMTIAHFVIQKDRVLTKAYNEMSRDNRTLAMIESLKEFTGNENIFCPIDIRNFRLEELYLDKNDGIKRVKYALNYLNILYKLFNNLTKQYYKNRLQV